MSVSVAGRSARLLAGAALSLAPVALSGAAAQSYPPPAPPADYPQGPPPQGGYPDRAYPQGGYTPSSADPRANAPVYDSRGPGPTPAYDPYATTPPPGYNGSTPPPPPPGYQDGAPNPAQLEADHRYGAYVQDWSQRYCVKSHSDAGVGAVVGGVAGALLGSSVAGWHDRGTGALVGGIAGAGAGAAIGSTSGNATSPGCPPGYVVRRDAPAFYYEGYGDPYYYAAPGWYQPWVFYGGIWTYRPYPYHVWYYGHYGYGRGYYGRPYGRGYYGRGYSGRRFR